MRKKLSFTIFYLFIIILYFFTITACRTKTSLEVNNNYNLLFITIDTIRADHIGCYGYKEAQTPNIDNLADKGIKFENCYAPVPLTLPSHCSIFTGKVPFSHKVRSNTNYFLNEKETTLAELMKTKNYSTYAVISSFAPL